MERSQGEKCNVRGANRPSFELLISHTTLVSLGTSDRMPWTLKEGWRGKACTSLTSVATPVNTSFLDTEIK